MQTGFMDGYARQGTSWGMPFGHRMIPYMSRILFRILYFTLSERQKYIILDR